jgi:hypothetical protein
VRATLSIPLVLSLCTACGNGSGGAGGGAGTTGAGASGGTGGETDGDGDGAAGGAGGLAARWTGRGERSYAEGDFVRAAEAFDRALQADESMPRARAGKARTLVTLGKAAEAAALLEGVDDPAARALRATALYLADDPAAASLLEALAPEKGLAKEALAVVRALRGRRAHRVDGRRTSIPLLTQLPLPAVPAAADGVSLHMLVDTGAFATVLDRAVARRLRIEGSAGVIGQLDLEGIAVHDVPVVVRDLTDLSRGLGGSVTGVIGMQLLSRLHATIDYPSGWLLLRADAPDVEAGAGTRLPYFLVDGQYLTVRGRANDAPEGAYLVSGGGTFAVALSDDGLRAAGRDAGALTREGDGFARYALARLRLGSLEITEIPAVHFVFPERLSTETGVRFQGVLSHAFLAQWRVTFDSEAHTMVLERGGEGG